MKVCHVARIRGACDEAHSPAGAAPWASPAGAAPWASKRRRGQALVEFALGMPLIILLTLAVIDLARGVYTYNTLSNCAREGARFGIVLVDDAWGDTDYLNLGNAAGTYASAAPYVGTHTIVGRVVAKAGILDPALLKVTISHSPTGTEAGLKLPVRVIVEYPFTPAITYLMGGTTINLKG